METLRVEKNVDEMKKSDKKLSYNASVGSGFVFTAGVGRV